MKNSFINLKRKEKGRKAKISRNVAITVILLAAILILIIWGRSRMSHNAEQASLETIWGQASSAMLEGEVQQALLLYDAAVKKEAGGAELYRDYGAALVLAGKKEEAQACLIEAKKRNLSADSEYLLTGGLALLDRETDAAADLLERCLQMTEDEQVKYYAYCFQTDFWAKEAAKLSNTPDETIEALERKQKIWQEAASSLGEHYQSYICASQQKLLLELYEASGSPVYLDQALDQVELAEEKKWDTYETGITKASIFEEYGKYKEAGEILRQLIQTHGETWTACGLLAILEAEYQNDLPRKQRNYEEFLRAYENASVLYRKLDSEEGTERLHERVEDIYRQVKLGGWIQD